MTLAELRRLTADLPDSLEVGLAITGQGLCALADGAITIEVDDSLEICGTVVKVQKI